MTEFGKTDEGDDKDFEFEITSSAGLSFVTGVIMGSGGLLGIMIIFTSILLFCRLFRKSRNAKGNCLSGNANLIRYAERIPNFNFSIRGPSRNTYLRYTSHCTNSARIKIHLVLIITNHFAKSWLHILSLCSELTTKVHTRRDALTAFRDMETGLHLRKHLNLIFFVLYFQAS